MVLFTQGPYGINMFNLVDKRSNSKRIAFALLLVVGCMSIIGHSNAAGSGTGVTDVHLELHVTEGMENWAIGVGLSILIVVYILIILRLSIEH